MLSKGVVGQRSVAGEIVEWHPIPADLLYDSEDTFHHALTLIARLGERLANEELEARIRLSIGLQ
jgi:hypothetical protein